MSGIQRGYLAESVFHDGVRADVRCVYFDIGRRFRVGHTCVMWPSSSLIIISFVAKPRGRWCRLL